MRISNVRFNLSLILLLCGTVLFLMHVHSSLAQSSEGQLCIPLLGTDPAAPTPPTLDGVIESWAEPDGTKHTDSGWNRAAKINLNANPSSPTKTAEMLVGMSPAGNPPPGLPNRAYLLLGLTVETTITPGVNDTVVLMLSTDSNPQHDWRIFIKPFNSASAAAPDSAHPELSDFRRGVPDSVSYWRDSDHWRDLTAVTKFPQTGHAEWLRVRAADGSNLTDATAPGTLLRVSREINIWSLEMAIPITNDPAEANIGDESKIFFSPTSTFRMYVNVLSTDDLSASFHNDPWPTWPQAIITAPATGSPDLLENNTPPKQTASPSPEPIWGTASLFNRPTECSGISLEIADSGIENPTSSASPVPLQYGIRTLNPLPSPFPSPASGQTATEACLAIPDGSFPSDLGPPNRFTARPRTTQSPAPNDLSVTFRVYNYGIPPNPRYRQWDMIQSEPVSPGSSTLRTNVVTPSNPVGCSASTTPCAFAGSVTNSSGVTENLLGNFTTTWRLTYKQSCVYRQTNNSHNCILVEMDSNDASVRFLNRSVAYNVDFVPASKVSRTAEISAVGYPAPPAGQTNQRFIIAVDTEIQRFGRGVTVAPAFPVQGARKDTQGNQGRGLDRRYLPRLGSEEIRNMIPGHFPDGVTEALVWTARGYRRTGGLLRINGHAYEYTEPVGAFIYVAGHNGPVQSWNSAFTGGGLVKVNDYLYTVEIPPGSAAVVTTSIEAVEQTVTGGSGGFFSLGLRGGVAIPHSPFNSIYDASGAFTADLEYHATNFFSVSGQFGYRRFSSGTPLVSGLNLFQFSGGPKVYLSNSAARPFINGGIGAFKFDPGSTKFGTYVGGGMQFRVWPKLWLEGEYDFHSVFTPGQNFKFSTVQGGVRIRF
jgi:hypothetical protein